MNELIKRDVFSTPYVLIHGESILGFDKRKIDSALGKIKQLSSGKK
jgi:hypothetical protein